MPRYGVESHGHRQNCPLSDGLAHPNNLQLMPVWTLMRSGPARWRSKNRAKRTLAVAKALLWHRRLDDVRIAVLIGGWCAVLSLIVARYWF
jgi:hypothetical protein